MGCTVLLADDHEVVRFGMTLLLEGEGDIEVVGEAGSAPEVLALAQQLHPSLILLDLGMPGVMGFSLITDLRQAVPESRILVLSMYKDQRRVLGALRAGAAGYVLKENQAGEIVRAIREVSAGRKYLSPTLAEEALDNYISGTAALEPTLDDLTPREREIIERAAVGKTSAEIAKEFYISVRTVETHRGRAMQKLNLHNHVELVRFFVNLELLEPDRLQPGDLP